MTNPKKRPPRATISMIVPNVDQQLYELAHDIQPSLLLTFAVNTLSVAWQRHAGGKLSKQDRMAIMGALVFCARALRADEVPNQAGNIPQRMEGAHAQKGGAR